MKTEIFTLKRNARFKRKLFSAIIFSLLILIILLIVNLLTSPEYLWILWIALGYVALLLLVLVKYFLDNSVFNKKWEKRYIQKRLKKDDI